MGFFQSLKEDLSASVEDIISSDDNMESIEETATFMDGEPLLSDEGSENSEIADDFSSASYEQNIDDLLSELKSISEDADAVAESDNNTEEDSKTEVFSVRDALNSLKKASKRREEDMQEEPSQEESPELEEAPQQLEFDFDLEETKSEEEILTEKILAVTEEELTKTNSNVEESVQEKAEADVQDISDLSALVDETPTDGSTKMGVIPELLEDIVPASDSEQISSNTEEKNFEASLEEAKEALNKESLKIEAPEEDQVLSELLKEYQDKLGNVPEETEEATAEVEEEIAPIDEELIISEEDEISDETAVITSGMNITGNMTSNGNLDLLGSITGDICIKGKLNVAGKIQGNSEANEIFIDGAEIFGNVSATGSVKIGQGSVILGDVRGTGAVIAGAVKGEIDVKGPVILDSSAIVMGNIKSMSVQINNGAVIEGMCSQCYASVNPVAFFEDLKK